MGQKLGSKLLCDDKLLLKNNVKLEVAKAIQTCNKTWSAVVSALICFEDVCKSPFSVEKWRGGMRMGRCGQSLLKKNMNHCMWHSNREPWLHSANVYLYKLCLCQNYVRNVFWFSFPVSRVSEGRLLLCSIRRLCSLHHSLKSPTVPPFNGTVVR